MPLITTRQLQGELQVSEVTLWKYRKQGMPYKPLGARLVRYDLSDVLEWLGSRERVVRPFLASLAVSSDNERWGDCFEPD
jgi:predicted DNA-binding transcriptional regulator AlpA